MSNRAGPLATAALAVGVLGSAVALAAFQFAGLGNSSSPKNSAEQRRRKRPQQTFQSIQPRGLHWWEVSKDYPGADDMPRVLQISSEDEKYWESLPVHSSPNDPFALHENFVEALVASKRCNIANLEQIMRDIPRTFPDEEYFRDTDVQDTMRRILTAVCVEYPEIGYVQSMNFLVGFLFLHSKTEDACFALFRRIMSHPRMLMEEMYKPGLPLLFKVLEALQKLTQKYVPACHAKFEEVGLEYVNTMTWFMTLFTYSMDWAKVGPIWDVFFERGWEGPLRIGLFMIRDNAPQILDGDFDSISVILREACENAPLDICARSLQLNLDDEDRETIAAVTRLSV